MNNSTNNGPYFHLQTPDWQDLANCRDAEGVMDSTEDDMEGYNDD